MSNKKQILVKKLKQNPYGNKKIRNLMFYSTILICLLMFLYAFVIPEASNYFNKYYNKVYPNTYLNGNLLEDVPIKELEKELSTKINNFNERTITLKNKNKSIDYKISDIGLTFNNEEIIHSIKEQSSKFSIFNRFKGKTEYTLKLNEDSKLEEFLSNVEKEFNSEPKNGKFKRDKKFKVTYEDYSYGFVLDKESLKSVIVDLIDLESNEINLSGEETEFKNIRFLDVNKKVSTYKTVYYDSTAPARMYNVKKAIDYLDGTIIEPGKEFSFYNTCGNYDTAHGYIFYYHDVGSGVCQVATTIYDAALLANYKITSRCAHGKQVWYVPGAFDATVYGPWTDFKFKNNYKYPLYISAYYSGKYIYVDFWSSEKINENVSYKLRSVNNGGLSYTLYRDKYVNGEKTKTEKINYSSYFAKY